MQRYLCFVSWLLFSSLLVVAQASAADVVELLSGARVTGEITAQNDKTLQMKVTVSGVTLNRSYPLSSVHAVTTTDGKRTVINEKGSSPSKGPGTSPAVGSSGRPAA